VKNQKMGNEGKPRKIVDGYHPLLHGKTEKNTAPESYLAVQIIARDGKSEKREKNTRAVGLSPVAPSGGGPMFPDYWDKKTINTRTFLRVLRK